MAAMWPARVRRSPAWLTRSSVALTFTRANSKGEQNDKGWFRSLFVHKVNQRKDAHSNLLSKKETSNLYKMQFHNVKPECLDAYNNLSEQILQKLHNDPDYPCEIVGSWNTWYGEQDQAVHLWRFSGGYPAMTDAMEKLKENKEYMEFRKERSKMLLARKNQILLEFSFWNEPVARPGPNIYELRTYYLKPGTMIEWGNNWARAIRFRQENNEAVGGFFSLVGDLYVVHHIWAYKDLESRHETRNAAWQKAGWDECVYYTEHRWHRDYLKWDVSGKRKVENHWLVATTETAVTVQVDNSVGVFEIQVPLIRYMESRIMIPLKVSTLQ